MNRTSQPRMHLNLQHSVLKRQVLKTTELEVQLKLQFFLIQNNMQK